MIRLAVRVIGVDAQTSKEVILADVRSHRFDPTHLDAQVALAIHEACKLAKVNDDMGLRAWQPEISIALSADEEEQIRPSFHLEPNTICQIAKAGASIDFDPYV